jgi:hypothetical protein
MEFVNLPKNLPLKPKTPLIPPIKPVSKTIKYFISFTKQYRHFLQLTNHHCNLLYKLTVYPQSNNKAKKACKKVNQGFFVV